MSRAKFNLGQVVATPHALEELAAEEVQQALRRHASGDWGEVDEEDRQDNELALRQSFRLFSVYRTAAGRKFWIITEADRSATTVLMPEDY